MTCETWRTKLDAYADGELPPETMRSMAGHLSGCPACTASIVRILQQKRLTASAGRRYAASTELRARVRRQIAARPAARAWRWGLGLALGAAAVAWIGLAVLLPSQAARDRLIADVVDRHVTALAGSSPVDVVSSDRHTVKPWFQGKLPFTFNLPELEGTPFTLVGGRMIYLDGQPGAHLLCDVRKHHLSVLIVEDRGEMPRRLPASPARWRSRAFTVESWSGGGLRFFVVGDAAPEQVSALAALLKAAN